MTDRTQFLQERTQGVGGSDIASMLSNQIDVEYGCERNLHARLSGVPEDNPGRETELMTLGHVTEPYVRRAYSDRTGRRVEVVGFKKHPTIPCLQYHDDGIIYPNAGDDWKTNGVLEAKGVGREMMAKMNSDGIVIDYVLQHTGGCLVHGLGHGSFAVSTREDLLPLVAIELTAKAAGNPLPVLPRQPRILSFDLVPDKHISHLIEEYAPVFWATVGDLSKSPQRYEPESTRCQRCPRKVWCHGPEIANSVVPENSIPKHRDLEPLIQEYRDRVALFEEAESLVKETEGKFKTLLGKQTAIQVPVIVDGKEKWKNILWRLSKARETVDGKRMAASYDALRRAAIDGGIAGAELVPPSGDFINVGLPSRPLRLSGILPKKEKKPGEVPEWRPV